MTQDGIDLCAVKFYEWEIFPPKRQMSGTIHWTWPFSNRPESSINYSLRYEAAHNTWSLYLAYLLECAGAGGRVQIETTVPLVRTSMHYGGARYWFLCPWCHQRKGVLFLPPEANEFACRWCHDLTYKSQRLDRLNRAFKRLKGIHERLGTPSDIEACFPKRPKYMHWSTYLSHLHTATLVKERIASETNAKLRKLVAREPK